MFEKRNGLSSVTSVSSQTSSWFSREGVHFVADECRARAARGDRRHRGRSVSDSGAAVLRESATSSSRRCRPDARQSSTERPARIALEQIVGVAEREPVVGVDVEPPEQVFFPRRQRVGADTAPTSASVIRHSSFRCSSVADELGELRDDLRILGVAPERDLRHLQVFADQELDRRAARRRAVRADRACFARAGRSPARDRLRAICRHRGTAARG